jgi:DNA-binding response OmpR family regulator
LEELTILVIEDDLAVQAVVDEALCDGGYEPALASSGEEAITLLRARITKYRALVIDINLAGRTNGWDVARAAREIDPEFPVVYMTGAAAEEWSVQGVPNSVLLAKPFAPAQLITAISNLLNTGGPSPSPSG